MEWDEDILKRRGNYCRLLDGMKKDHISEWETDVIAVIYKAHSETVIGFVSRMMIAYWELEISKKSMSRDMARIRS
jgi:hypothetical protein